MSGTLYLCATPIGNLEDITARVLSTLAAVDLIAAEDTRNTLRLLNHFDIHTELTSYHEYNRVGKAQELIRRLQNTVFSAHCLINAWYCEKAPWLDLDCEDAVRRLLQIREGLKPRLRRAFDRYRDEGVPPVRALVCEYTDDKATYDVNDEYLFCDDLLVAPVIAGQSERQVYLPAGKWVHYLDGRAFEAGSFRYTCRDAEDLPVFRRLS